MSNVKAMEKRFWRISVYQRYLHYFSKGYGLLQERAEHRMAAGLSHKKTF
jgi:hypothetical protein